MRFESALSPALREVATLATAKEIQNQYVFTAHARLARQVNVSKETIEALKRGDAPEGIPRDDALVMLYVRELLRGHKLADSTFDSAKERFGVRGVVDLTGIVGHYLSVAQVINAFGVVLAPDATPELPA